MKKILYGVMAATMIFATSCENELELGATGEEAMVSFTIATPDMGSRADYSDGTTATVLQYAVYDAAGNELEDLTVTDGEINGSTTVNLKLTTGNTYSVVFWAAAPGAPYTVDFGAKTMTVDYTNAVSNDESRDAFYKYHEFTVTGAQTETIELKRPFAQLNIGTNDYAASTSAGYTPTQSAVTVKNLKNTLNFFDGTVTGADDARVFASAAIPAGQEFPVAGYEYLAMNYVLVGADKETVDVEFTYTDGSNAKTRTVGSVPVQRNYRTNIYGQLLTSDVDVNVEIEPEYDGENKVIVANNHATFVAAISNVTDGGVVRLNADVKVTEENRVNSGGTWYEGVYYVGDKSFTIDLNGFAFKNESGAVNDYMLLFKNDGEKPSTITIKNGIIDAGTAAYCALCTSTTSTQKITINLEKVELINNNANGATIKVRGGAELNVKEGVKIIGKNSYVGIEVVNAVTNIYDGAEIYQNGSGSYVGSLAGVSNNGVLNVYGGKGKSVQGGFIAMTSGGTINIEGGEWIANTDGTNANGNKSVLIAQSAQGANSIINVSGGTFKGGYNCYGDAVGDAQINIEGGNFNSDPSAYVADGLKAVANNGIYYIVAEEVDAVASSVAELTAALDGDSKEIYLSAGEYTMPAGSKFSSDNVLICAPGTVFTGNSKLNINGATIIGATFSNPTGSAVDQTINGSFKGCKFEGSNASRWCYAGETVVFEDCEFSGSVYGVHFDGGANDVIFRNCTISGFNALAGEITMVTFEGCTFKGNGKSGYNGANLWGSAKMVNCEFTFDGTTGNEWIDCIGASNTYEFVNCTVNGVAFTPENYTTFGGKIFSRNHVTVKINGADCAM